MGVMFYNLAAGVVVVGKVNNNKFSNKGEEWEKKQQ
jgi:hypothetical protein